MKNLPVWAWIFIIFLVLDALSLLFLFLLKRRGVTVKLKTKFGPALIFDSKDHEGTAIRLLNVAGKFQSVGYVDESLWAKLACIYHQYFAQVQDITGAPKSGVVIGGGGYSYPKYLATKYPEMDLDVIEIDSAITDIARTYFYVDKLEAYPRSGQLNLICADGFAYLKESKKHFDVIVNDAFGGKKPLGPLKTEEGAKIVSEHLTEDGIYLANVICALKEPKDTILQESVSAAAKYFAFLYLIPEDEDEPELVQDNVFVAAKRPLDIAKKYRLDATRIKETQSLS